MNDINDHIDEFGFVVSTEPDVESRGGNSAQHSAIYYIAEGLNFDKQWDLLDREGEPRLHWTGWPKERGHMSRDNLTCCVCALKLSTEYVELRLAKLMYQIFTRLGLLWNYKRIGDDHWNVPDFCGPLMWMVALRFKWSPLNIISDLYLYLSIQIQLRNTRKNLTHTDGHLNLIIIGETCRRVSDNFILNKILGLYKDTNVPQYAACDYFNNQYSAPLHIQLCKIVDGW